MVRSASKLPVLRTHCFAAINIAAKQVTIIVSAFLKRITGNKPRYDKASARSSEDVFICTNQQPPQRGGAVPDPVWVGSKWLLAFPWVPVTPGTPLYFSAMLPPEQPQKGSTQHLQSRSPVFTFSFLLPFFVSSFFFS